MGTVHSGNRSMWCPESPLWLSSRVMVGRWIHPWAPDAKPICYKGRMMPALPISPSCPRLGATYSHPGASSSVEWQHWASDCDNPGTAQRWGWHGSWSAPATAAHSLGGLATEAAGCSRGLGTPTPEPGRDRGYPSSRSLQPTWTAERVHPTWPLTLTTHTELRPWAPFLKPGPGTWVRLEQSRKERKTEETPPNLGPEHLKASLNHHSNCWHFPSNWLLDA